MVTARRPYGINIIIPLSQGSYGGGRTIWGGGGGGGGKICHCWKIVCIEQLYYALKPLDASYDVKQKLRRPYGARRNRTAIVWWPYDFLKFDIVQAPLERSRAFVIEVCCCISVLNPNSKLDGMRTMQSIYLLIFSMHTITATKFSRTFTYFIKYYFSHYISLKLIRLVIRKKTKMMSS